MIKQTRRQAAKHASIRMRIVQGIFPDLYDNQRGYFVIPSAIQVHTDTRRIGESKPFFEIFNGQHSNDGKRSQTHFVHPNINRQLLDLCKNIFPFHVMNNGVTIRSEPGCQEQLSHCDYNPFSFNPNVPRNVPYGLLACIQESGSEFIIWEGSHQHVRTARNKLDPSSRTQIHLNAGDVVFFRGDLVHAGAAYSEANERVHYYLDALGTYRDPNFTWPVPSPINGILQ